MRLTTASAWPEACAFRPRPSSLRPADSVVTQSAGEDAEWGGGRAWPRQAAMGTRGSGCRRSGRFGILGLSSCFALSLVMYEALYTAAGINDHHTQLTGIVYKRATFRDFYH